VAWVAGKKVLGGGGFWFQTPGGRKLFVILADLCRVVLSSGREGTRGRKKGVIKKGEVVTSGEGVNFQVKKRETASTE